MAIHFIGVPTVTTDQTASKQQLHHEYAIVLITMVVVSCLDCDLQQVLDLGSYHSHGCSFGGGYLCVCVGTAFILCVAFLSYVYSLQVPKMIIYALLLCCLLLFSLVLTSILVGDSCSLLMYARHATSAPVPCTVYQNDLVILYFVVLPNEEVSNTYFVNSCRVCSVTKFNLQKAKMVSKK